MIYALTAWPASGWLSGPAPAAAVIGVAAWPGWYRPSGAAGAPMLRLSLFASRQFDAINIMTVLLYGALLPALIGATGGRSISRALAHGYQPAMLVMAGLCVAAALITGDPLAAAVRPRLHRRHRRASIAVHYRPPRNWTEGTMMGVGGACSRR